MDHVTCVKGVVPTPDGAIEISWTIDDNVFILELEILSGSLGTVCMSKSGFKSFSVVWNGEDVSKDESIVIPQ